MVDRLALTLLHFLWQGAAVAALVGVALLLARRASPGVRYGFALVAMAAMAVLPIVTFLRLAPASTVLSIGTVRYTSGETILAAAPAESRLPLVVGLWALGVVVLSLRLAASLLQLERWRRRHTVPAPVEAQDRLSSLARRIGVARPVRLFLSERIEVPSAWGLLRPVVVLPASLMMSLSPEGVEGILLHELAHIRRHDYLVNLLQSVVETALFYHPAVWWVSSVVRREREHLCDDAAVAVLGDPMPYARALLVLEERRQAPRPALSAKGGKLMNRIARLLTPKPAPVRISPVFPGLAALSVVALAMGGVLQAQAQPPKKEKNPTPPRVEASVEKRTETQKPASRKPKASPSKGAPIMRTDEAEKERLKREIEGLKGQLVTLRRQALAEQARQAASADRARQKALEVEAAMAERSALQKALAERQRSIAEAQAALERARAESSKAETERRQELDRVRAELDKARETARKAPVVEVPAAKSLLGDRVPVAPRKVPGLGDLPAVGGLFQYRAPEGKFDPAKPGTVYRLQKEFDGKGFSPEIYLNGKKIVVPPSAYKFDPKAFEGQRFAEPFKSIKPDAKALESLGKIYSKDAMTFRTFGSQGFSPIPKVEGNSRRISLDNDHASFVAVVRTIAKITGLNVVIAAGSYPDVTIVLQNQTPEAALRIVCKAANAELRVDKGVYTISPKKG